MEINEYFDTDEFTCKCGCGMTVINENLLAILTDVREHLGRPVYITSGNRCQEYNRLVGGADASRHLTGEAADIKVSRVHPDKVANYIELEHCPGGLGRYITFTHVDVRNVPRGEQARWRGI